MSVDAFLVLHVGHSYLKQNLTEGQRSLCTVLLMYLGLSIETGTFTGLCEEPLC